MQRRYVTADVFTDRMFGGNPLAVVLDAAGLSAGQMQAIASEFNYSETTFVLPPNDPAHTAWVRIFTPSREVPFAGHPNVGTAFVIAQDRAARGETAPDQFVFEEGRRAGPRHPDAGGGRRGRRCAARAGTLVPPVAACLRTTRRPVSRCRRRTFASTPTRRRSSRSAYPSSWSSWPRAMRCAGPSRTARPTNRGCRSTGRPPSMPTRRETDEAGYDLQARMFTPRMTEDPATGKRHGSHGGGCWRRCGTMRMPSAACGSAKAWTWDAEPAADARAQAGRRRGGDACGRALRRRHAGPLPPAGTA